MSALIWPSSEAAWSGGESRADGPADDAHGALELDPVRVDPGRGSRSTRQGADGVVGQQVAPDLLLDQGRGLRAQHPSRAAQVRLELGVPGLMLPPLVVGPGQLYRGGGPVVGDGGD